GRPLRSRRRPPRRPVTRLCSLCSPLSILCSLPRPPADEPQVLRSGHHVALCSLCLLLLGVVMVTSAGLEVDPIPAAEPVTVLENPPRFLVSPAPETSDVRPQDAFIDVIFSRPAMYMVLATMAMTVASVLPVRRLAGRLDRPASGRAALVVL